MIGSVMLATAVAIVALMVVVWIISVARTDVSLVDIAWGFGFVVVAWVAFWVVGEAGPRRWLLVVLTSIWGLRLSIYLAWRNLGSGEDFRYQVMRRKSPDTFWWKSLFTVFGLQAILMWMVSLPVQMGPIPDPGLGLLDWLGAAAWVVGIVFEATGDWQLARFKADPANKGKVMDQGLWRYTRHPNYFGDFMVWWGLYLIALSAGQWWTVVGPIVMSVLLMRVSGVGLLEKTITKRRPGYEEYMERTNAFFPGPPRSG